MNNPFLERHFRLHSMPGIADWGFQVGQGKSDGHSQPRSQRMSRKSEKKVIIHFLKFALNLIYNGWDFDQWPSEYV
jgi:hypothetical protein